MRVRHPVVRLGLRGNLKAMDGGGQGAGGLEGGGGAGSPSGALRAACPCSLGLDDAFGQGTPTALD